MINEDAVNLDELKQHTYNDTSGEIFYTYPICGHEYLSTFITRENGEVMCVECCDKKFG